MEIINKVAMVSINETLFIELISFLIFLFLINRIMFRPIQSAMRKREQHVGSISEEIENSRHTIDELNRQLKEQEEAAMAEANRQRIELENEGAKAAGQILDESKNEIYSIRSENSRFVEAQIAEARNKLRDETERLAREMMEKILDRRLIRE